MANTAKNELRYIFHPISECNMCGSLTSSNKVLGKRLNGSQGRKPETKIGVTVSIIQCAKCGLIYSTPQPRPFDIQDHYGIPPEDYWKRKDDYFKISDNYYKKEIGILKSLLNFKEGMKVLEIGAGLGKGMIMCERAGFEAYGLESSEPFYERAISQMKISPDRLQLTMVENADYAENQFDVINMLAVLEHFYDASDSVERALKWVKPGGLIYIEVPSSNWLIGRMLNAYYKLTGRDYVGNLSPMHEPFHLYEFSLKSFEENAKKLNYEIAFHEFYPCDTYMPKVLDSVLKSYMQRTDTGMQLVVVLRKK
jgi:2-polyprenyl-3-methyl-5-hydroxy-6-metoxy-1,4-benzoquinol methylase